MAQEQWLDMELFLRMTTSHAPLYEDILLPSLLMFWPKDQLRLIVVLDAENADDVAWRPRLEKQLAAAGMASYKIFMEEPSDVYEGVRTPGHNRMQWGMFWPDKYVTAEYVGFLDTDTLFTTIVHPGALYKNGRPIIFGLVGLPPEAFFSIWWQQIGNKTAMLLNKPEVMRAMNYFPVIMKVSHIVEMRSHITKRMGENNFNAAFKAFTKEKFNKEGELEGTQFSQFNIMANYLFYHKHCEYWFAYQELRPGFRDHVPGQTDCLDYILDEVHTMPQVRVAMHWGYSSDTTPERKNAVAREGYCRSGGTAQFAGCEAWPKLDNPGVSLQESLFEFEFHNWTWNPLCRRAQIKHYAEVAHFQHKWPENLEELLNKLSVGNVYQ